jgi:hypothetical protein
MNNDTRIETKAIATTIITQLTFTKDRQVKVWSWGLHSLDYGIDQHENLGFAIFNVEGMLFQGQVKISLEFDDTYTVKFIQEGEVTKSRSNVYWEELNEVIDQEVELIEEYKF